MASSGRPRRDRRWYNSLTEVLEVRVVLTIDPTTTTLVESLSSTSYGTNVTLTATVASNNGVPTGMVLFQDGATILGVASLSGGAATISTSTLAVGPHLIRAVYEGSVDFYDSVSGGISQSSTISTVAGNGTAGHSGNGGQATAAELSNPTGVAFDAAGDLFISDGANVRKVAPDGVISNYAGNGT